MKIDIAGNIKAAELLKVEILQGITDLFGDISAEADSETHMRLSADGAKLICRIYLLCSRLGIEYKEIDRDMSIMLREGIEQEHILDRRFGDLKGLLKHLEGKEDYYEKH